MPIYTCQRCNKEFDRKDTFEYHVYKKKYPCRAININKIDPIITNQNQPNLITNNDQTEFKCQKCDKSYSNNSNRNRHMIHCKGVILTNKFATPKKDSNNTQRVVTSKSFLT